jgi:hypothetical protein
MSKKHKVMPLVGYLKCTECGHVTDTNLDFQIGSAVKPSRVRLTCGCEEYGARHISKEEGFDAIVRQQIEGMAA